MSDNEWVAVLDQWSTYLTAIGAPSTTKGQRLYHVGRLGREIDREPWTITFDQLVAWLATHRWSPNTRRSYRSSLRAFYAWGMATGRAAESPAHLLPPVKIPRAKPRPVPEPVYREGLRTADDRARLAIMLGGRCALRRGEIARVRREDVATDLIGRTLRVVGKGGHVRLVPLPDDLAALIEGMPPGWLFPSSHGGHLTPHHLGKVVKKALGSTTHTLRHRAGTTAYAVTHDLRAVQEFLGHAKPETTAIYTEIPGEDVRAAMEAAAA